MFPHWSGNLMRQLRWICIGLLLMVAPVYGQSDSELNLNGVIDFHVHAAPDSEPRNIDADDLARMAKKMGMRGIVLKNHYEDTAALAYMMRKEVPGIELFGGITMDLTNGGICLESVEHMTAMKGGWGRVVWLPTYDSEHDVKNAAARASTPRADSSTASGAANRSCGGQTKEAGTGPFVRVSENGHLVPSVLELIDYIAKHPQMVLETGHLYPEEILLVTHEAQARGAKHVVITHAISQGMTIPQMQAAAKDGAFVEITYLSMLLSKDQARTFKEYANTIRAVGPKNCIIATDVGRIMTPQPPLEPQAMIDFMQALRKEGISVADINLMAKTNPALALGLRP
jgi:hypothetical protein